MQFGVIPWNFIDTSKAGIRELVYLPIRATSFSVGKNETTKMVYNYWRSWQVFTCSCAHTSCIYTYDISVLLFSLLVISYIKDGEFAIIGLIMIKIIYFCPLIILTKNY